MLQTRLAQLVASWQATVGVRLWKSVFNFSVFFLFLGFLGGNLHVGSIRAWSGKAWTMVRILARGSQETGSPIHKRVKDSFHSLQCLPGSFPDQSYPVPTQIYYSNVLKLGSY